MADQIWIIFHVKYKIIRWRIHRLFKQADEISRWAIPCHWNHHRRNYFLPRKWITNRSHTAKRVLCTIVIAETATLNRINDQFARYSWHFLPLHVRNGKPLASVANRDAWWSFASAALFAEVTDSSSTRVVAFALRALANWDGCGICVITRSERLKNPRVARATFGAFVRGILPYSRPFVRIGTDTPWIWEHTPSHRKKFLNQD